LKTIFNINSFAVKERGFLRMTQISQAWLDKLSNSGYRLTGSRRMVVEIIANSERALTPLELYDIARQRQAGIGLVTVYRTLEKLEELELIQRVHQPQGCQAFIAAFTGHQHLILCSRCGKVQFFQGDDLHALIQEIGEHTGYQVHDHWLQLFGLCASCQGKA
jgi:Fe2+ or Zn2+ uptake regulation protein